MTKYKLLKPIKGVEWEVGEVRELESNYGIDYIPYKYIRYNTCMSMHPPELALLEHAGFIEEVNEVQPETPKRWRAERCGYYFYLDENLTVSKGVEWHSRFDDNLYEAGNYFQTTEQIEEFRKGVKALVGIK